jgi:hypothetical protein
MHFFLKILFGKPPDIKLCGVNSPAHPVSDCAIFLLAAYRTWWGRFHLYFFLFYAGTAAVLYLLAGTLNYFRALCHHWSAYFLYLSWGDLSNMPKVGYMRAAYGLQDVSAILAEVHTVLICPTFFLSSWLPFIRVLTVSFTLAGLFVPLFLLWGFALVRWLTAARSQPTSLVAGVHGDVREPLLGFVFCGCWLLGLVFTGPAFLNWLLRPLVLPDGHGGDFGPDHFPSFRFFMHRFSGLAGADVLWKRVFLFPVWLAWGMLRYAEEAYYLVPLSILALCRLGVPTESFWPPWL